MAMSGYSPRFIGTDELTNFRLGCQKKDLALHLDDYANDLHLGINYCGQLMKQEMFGYQPYEPDLLDLALNGCTVEIEMINYLRGFAKRQMKLYGNWSGWQDSNLRSPAPKAGGLPAFLHPDKSWCPV